MTRAPIKPLLAEIMAEVCRQEAAGQAVTTGDALDDIAETVIDLGWEAESAEPDHIAHRRRGGVKMAVLALRLLRDGCGGGHA